MANYYGLILTLHLLTAIIFVGAVFFEVLVIEPLQKKLPPGAAQVAEAIPDHVRTFMPHVVAVLFLSGAAMFWIHFTARPDFFSSRFGLLLALKLVLAFSVLGVFVVSIRAARRGTMDVCRFRLTHRIVAPLDARHRHLGQGYVLHLRTTSAGPTTGQPLSHMNTITLDTTIGDIVRAAPIRARVFERLGIDYCCGGKKPLLEVCHAKGLDPTTVATMLAALDGTNDESLTDADRLPLSQLCDHIVQVHHEYLREELPRLDFMTRKVAAVHGEHEPRLVEIRAAFVPFATELASHMIKEEEAVFPRIRQLGQPGADRAAIASELREALNELEREHDSAGDALSRFHSLTDRYTPPEWACNTFRALYDSLARLEQNMHQHVHKENNVLFPRALSAG